MADNAPGDIIIRRHPNADGFVLLDFPLTADVIPSVDLDAEYFFFETLAEAQAAAEAIGGGDYITHSECDDRTESI